MEFLNSRNLERLAVIFFAVGLFGLVIVVISGLNQEIGAISALLITGAAVFTAAVKFHSEERDRAFKLLNEHSNSKELLEALEFVGKVINKNQIITHETACKIYISDDGRDKLFIKKMFLIYNFFEEIAIGIKYKQINQDILKEFYAGMLYRFYNSTSVFLPIIRNYPNLIENHPFGKTLRPDIFENVKWLFKEWKPFYESFLQQSPDELPAR